MKKSKLDFQKNKDLARLTTFGVHAKAAFFVDITNEEDVFELLSSKIFKDSRKIILGGGSNVLFAGNYDGLVIHNAIKGINVESTDKDDVYIKAGAGENWHEFVEYCVKNGFHGLENLALIPGNLGAAPVQNIGAYGVEQNMFFVSLEGIDLVSGEKKTFNNAECKFGYRDSVFKNELKGKFLITSVTYRLNKNFTPNIFYRDLKLKFEDKEPSAKELFDAVIEIRRSKLPEPEELGNAGSFFKNPVITLNEHDKFTSKFPDMHGRETEDHRFKLSAAKLIDTAGWKGKTLNDTDAGVYEGHALILINHGNATGEEIYELSERIIADIREQFGITLEREVNIIK